MDYESIFRKGEWVSFMEESFLLFLQEYVRFDWLTPIMKGLSFLGDYGGACWIVLTLLMMIWKKTRWVGFTMGVSLALSGIFTNLVIKNLFFRDRPYEVNPDIEPLGNIPSDTSFPSGHASVVFALATVLCLTLPWIMEKKKAIIVSALFVVLAVLLAFSRLYLGVHFPTDVLVGALLGIVYGIVARAIIGPVKKKFDNGTRSADV